MKGFRRFISTFLVTVMAVSLLSACGKPAENNSGSSTKQSAAASVKSSAVKSGSTATDTSNGNNPVAGKKVAYIMIMPSATIFQMWKDSCQKLCDALDVKFDFFFCDGDFNKWQDTIRTCASAGYDGLLVSHGNQDGSYVFLKEILEQYPKLKIVTVTTPP